ncbi:hypothetical protein KBB08_00020 [Candidatus Gracilibacteria bacterium]|nr:hypothetical protein [Candidatus Gracilibacteria bacterium]
MPLREKPEEDIFAKARQWAASFTANDRLSPEDIEYIHSHFPTLLDPESTDTLCTSRAEMVEQSRLVQLLEANATFVTQAREGYQARQTRNELMATGFAKDKAARDQAKRAAIQKEESAAAEQKKEMNRAIDQQIANGAFTVAIMERLVRDVCLPDAGATKPAESHNRNEFILGIANKIAYYEQHPTNPQAQRRLAELRESQAYLALPQNRYLLDWVYYYYEARMRATK